MTQIWHWFRTGFSRWHSGEGRPPRVRMKVQVLSQHWLSPREVIRIVSIEDEGRVYKLALSSGPAAQAMLVLNSEERMAGGGPQPWQS
jgi:hypothetical protein